MSHTTARRIDLRRATPALFAALGELGRQAAAVGLEPGLRELLKLRVSQINECTYCIALHTAMAHSHGEPAERIAALATPRESALIDDRGWAALALAEALTRMDIVGLDGIHTEAAAVLDESEIAAVPWTAAIANAWNRIAVGSGMNPRRPAAGT
jgi:AhpD family alkylhydroperoxidase